MAKYTTEQLNRNLTKPGWRSVTGNSAMPASGTLGEMAEAAHSRKKNGHAVGSLQEIETEIEIDALQLQELWLHMGLPTL